jgi:hypothetical protein
VNLPTPSHSTPTGGTIVCAHLTAHPTFHRTIHTAAGRIPQQRNHPGTDAGTTTPTLSDLATSNVLGAAQ